jgi:hypothetical protein
MSLAADFSAHFGQCDAQMVTDQFKVTSFNGKPMFFFRIDVSEGDPDGDSLKSLKAMIEPFFKKLLATHESKLSVSGGTDMIKGTHIWVHAPEVKNINDFSYIELNEATIHLGTGRAGSLESMEVGWAVAIAEKTKSLTPALMYLELVECRNYVS